MEGVYITCNPVYANHNDTRIAHTQNASSSLRDAFVTCLTDEWISIINEWSESNL